LVCFGFNPKREHSGALMSGLNISCGKCFADDKAGSAFERVLEDLPNVSDDTKRDILSGFDNNEHTTIGSDIAVHLIDSLRRYRDQLVSEIGHGDWLKEMDREQETGANPVELKWGEGRGWRLYCAVNLLAACEHSSVSQEPVVVCLG
jgi:hypothetical protein